MGDMSTHRATMDPASSKVFFDLKCAACYKWTRFSDDVLKNMFGRLTNCMHCGKEHMLYIVNANIEFSSTPKYEPRWYPTLPPIDTRSDTSDVEPEWVI